MNLAPSIEYETLNDDKGPFYFYRKTFFISLVLASLFILPFVVVEWIKTGQPIFLYYGDYNVQQIPFYEHAVRAVHEGAFGWDWYTDLGSNFIGSYSYYMLGSPFFWLMCLFPSAWAPALMAPIYILKFAVAAVLAFAFLQRFVKDKNYAVIGALLYAFSGFQIYNVFFNQFHEVVAFFPLLLIGIEETIQNNRRGVFALAVAVNAMVNYFMFAGQVAFCLIYFMIRCSKRSFRIALKNFICLAIEAVLGVAISAVLFLPATLAIIGNPRVSGSLSGWNMLFYRKSGTSYDTRYLHIIESYFFPPDIPSRVNFAYGHDERWASNAIFLPVFGMTGVFAYMKSRVRSWVTWLCGILMLASIVPVLNSTFFLLNGSYYARWNYLMIMVFCIATIIALEDRKTDWKTGISVSGFFTALIAVYVGFEWWKEDKKVTWKLGHLQFVSRYWIYIGITVVCFIMVYALIKYYRGRTEKVIVSMTNKSPDMSVVKYRTKNIFVNTTLLFVSIMIVFYSVIHIFFGKMHSWDSNFVIGQGFLGEVNPKLSTINYIDENAKNADNPGDEDDHDLAIIMFDKSTSYAFDPEKHEYINNLNSILPIAKHGDSIKTDKLSDGCDAALTAYIYQVNRNTEKSKYETKDDGTKKEIKYIESKTYWELDKTTSLDFRPTIRNYDSVVFLVTVFNQGNENIVVDGINFYLNENLEFDLNQSENWVIKDNNIAFYEKPVTLTPGQTYEIPVVATLVADDSFKTNDPIQSAFEINSVKDNNDNKLIDIDSTPDDIMDNDLVRFYIDEKFYRIDFFRKTGSFTNVYDNLGMSWHIPSVENFHTVVPDSIMTFYDNMGISRAVASRVESKYYGFKSLFSVKYMLINEDKTNLVDAPGFYYIDTQNGFSIFKNSLYLEPGFAYQEFITEEDFSVINEEKRHIYLAKYLIVPKDEADYYSTFMKRVYPRKEKVDDSLKMIDIGATDTQQKMTYIQKIVPERRQYMCTDFEFSNYGFSANIALEEKSMVFFSVPYESGFSAKVNGIDTEIKKVTYGFVGVEVPAGSENHIEFSYETPGLKLGFLVTVGGIVLLIVYLIINKYILKNKPTYKFFKEIYMETEPEKEFLTINQHRKLTAEQDINNK